jgi:hypothetical protein
MESENLDTHFSVNFERQHYERTWTAWLIRRSGPRFVRGQCQAPQDLIAV